MADAVVERSRPVPVGPDEVWAVLADLAGIVAWAPDVDHARLLTEQTEGVGAARRIQTGRLTLVETVTEWDPGAVLAYTIEGLPPVVGGAANRWTLAATGAGTHLTLTTTVDPGHKPPGRVVAPLLARRLAKASDGMLAGLAAHLEATP